MIRSHPFLVICVATLFGSSLWFSVNAVGDGLYAAWGITTAGMGHLTSVLQFGFILGTLFIALSGIADRYSPSRIFLFSAIIGAIANGMFPLSDGDLRVALLLRFIVGVSLAGIYPIGMKLVVNWATGRTGNVLGWMVGMLALGSGAPHLVRGVDLTSHWQGVLYVTSVLAVIGGILVFKLGDGARNKNAQKIRGLDVISAFKIPGYRAAAFGYFGHMWELYAFFSLIPVILGLSAAITGDQIYIASFAVFVASAAGCIVGGLLTWRWGSARVAIVALVGSGLMCACIPWLYSISDFALVLFMMLWALFIAADSPQFSSLAARACPPERVGGALALMNCIGFGLTIFSIEIVSTLWEMWQLKVAWILLPGPIIGLYAMRHMWRNDVPEGQ
jgi:MFS family permease